MNKKLANLAVLSTRFNRNHLQLVFTILSLALLVLGVGAPSDGGGAGSR